MNYEAQIYSHLHTALSELKSYNITISNFYGMWSADALRQHIESKINGVRGAVFIRVGDVRYEAKDTQGTYYHILPQVEIIVGASPLKEYNQNLVERETDKIGRAVIKLLLDNPVPFSDAPSYPKLTSNRVWQRTSTIDAKQILLSYFTTEDASEYPTINEILA